MTDHCVPHFAPGAALPTVPLPTPTLEDCDRWMRAGDEFHAMHNDPEHARSMGMKDIVLPGLQLMAHLGRYVTGLVRRDDVRELGGRFESICYPSDTLTMSGTVVETFEAEGERRAKLDLLVSEETEGVRVRGEAVIAIN